MTVSARPSLTSTANGVSRVVAVCVLVVTGNSFLRSDRKALLQFPVKKFAILAFLQRTHHIPRHVETLPP
jgi:hypothetical protein